MHKMACEVDEFLHEHACRKQFYISNVLERLFTKGIRKSTDPSLQPFKESILIRLVTFPSALWAYISLGMLLSRHHNKSYGIN